MAVGYLQKKGYTIIECNFFTKHGEIDIIAKDSGYIVFVEVKRRQSNSFGYPREAMVARKIKKIQTVAAHYLEHTADTNQPRFDVIEILNDRVEHIINAF